MVLPNNTRCRARAERGVFWGKVPCEDRVWLSPLLLRWSVLQSPAKPMIRELLLVLPPEQSWARFSVVRSELRSELVSVVWWWDRRQARTPNRKLHATFRSSLRWATSSRPPASRTPCAAIPGAEMKWSSNPARAKLPTAVGGQCRYGCLAELMSTGRPDRNPITARSTAINAR